MPSRPGGAGGRPRRQPHPNITLPGVACRSISPSPGHRRPGGATDGFRGLYPPSRPWHGLCTPPQTPDLKHIDRQGLEVTWLAHQWQLQTQCLRCLLSLLVASDSLRPPRTAACRDPLSLEFSRQGYWSGLPFPSRGALPDPEIRTHISSVSCVGRRILYH